MGVDNENELSRREALKFGAKAAGVTAFAVPTVIGVFSAPALGQSPPLCSPVNDSDAVFGTIDSGGTWNTNCGGTTCPVVGRYNGQNAHFTLPGAGGGTVQVGSGGVDNFCTNLSFYNITAPGYQCTATWVVQNCTGPVLQSAGVGGQPLPYCSTNCNGVKLVLTQVACCPD